MLIVFFTNFQALLKPKEFQTSSPEGSTTTSIAIHNPHEISSSAAAGQDSRFYSEEDGWKEKSTQISHDHQLKG